MERGFGCFRKGKDKGDHRCHHPIVRRQRIIVIIDNNSIIIIIDNFRNQDSNTQHLNDTPLNELGYYCFSEFVSGQRTSCDLFLGPHQNPTRHSREYRRPAGLCVSWFSSNQGHIYIYISPHLGGVSIKDQLRPSLQNTPKDNKANVAGLNKISLDRRR